jgi:hypothetical protein
MAALAEDKMNTKALAMSLGLLAGPALATAAQSAGLIETYEIAEEAYIYAFPMIGYYKAMYQFFIDKTSSQYKGSMNELYNEARVFTPKDTAVVTPNSDTPYSFIGMDLRAEPMVICVPEIEKSRYYSIQLTSMYTFNFGYIGSRATGNGAGCYMVTGPSWKGDKPAGVARVFNSETDYNVAIFRTQLFRPSDMDNVKKIQAGYKAQLLSQFLGKPAAPALPQPNWPKFTENAFKTDAFAYLNAMMTYTPTVPEEVALRAKFAEIGIGPGKPYNYAKLPLESRLAEGLGIKRGFEKIEQEKNIFGTSVNGWRITYSGFGDRADYNGNWLERAAAALAGIFGNNPEEALYPLAMTDGNGQKLDDAKRNYTLTFPADGFPPVNAFWSVTMYDGKTQLLIENPINRYLINSPMLPDLKKNPDGSLTLYVQKDSPAADKESNWLPAPNGPIYMVMRLYWPKPEALNGNWKPPAIMRQ